MISHSNRIKLTRLLFCPTKKPASAGGPLDGDIETAPAPLEQRHGETERANRRRMLI